MIAMDIDGTFRNIENFGNLLGGFLFLDKICYLHLFVGQVQTIEG